jgi:sirohydrochlorin ferrochelatase
MLLGYRQGWGLPFESEAGIGPLAVHLGFSDTTDTSPLMVAVVQRHAPVVALLAAAASRRPHPNVAVGLRAAASSHGSEDRGGAFGVHRAAEVLNARDATGKTALVLACDMAVENLEIVRHLVR